jgi:hypothetical protein
LIQETHHFLRVVPGLFPLAIRLFLTQLLARSEIIITKTKREQHIATLAIKSLFDILLICDPGHRDHNEKMYRYEGRKNYWPRCMRMFFLWGARRQQQRTQTFHRHGWGQSYG